MPDLQPGEPDDLTIQRVLGGDTNAFSLLVERHWKHVLGTCIRITRNRDTAEDCTQISLTMAFERLGQFRSEAPFAAWLTRIAANVALSHLRKERPGNVAEYSLDGVDEGHSAIQIRDSRLDPEAACYRREIAALLQREIDALPPKFRIIVVLRELHGLSTAQTAQAVGIGLEAVKSRLFRAHRRMRRRLKSATARA